MLYREVVESRTASTYPTLSYKEEIIIKNKNMNASADEEYVDDGTFFINPYSLSRAPKYKDLSVAALYIYGLLRDRSNLSKKNNWCDEHGVYVLYSLESIMADSHCKRDKTISAMNELIDAGLVEKVFQGYGKPNRFYVSDVLIAPKSAQPSRLTRIVGSADLKTAKVVGSADSKKPKVVGSADSSHTVYNHTIYSHTEDEGKSHTKESYGDEINENSEMYDRDSWPFNSFSAENNKFKEDYGDVSDNESVKDYENQTYDDHPLPPPAPLDSATRAYFKRTKNELPPPEYFDQFKASPSEPARAESDAEKEERFRSSETYQYLLRVKAEREAAMAAPPTETKSGMQIAHEKQMADQAELEAALAECDWYPEDDE